MTLFEYLSIAYALLLSLGAVRLLNGVSHVMHAGRVYWVHATWVVLALLFSLLLFWHHWSNRDLEWTFLTFTINLAGPGMIYFLSCTLVPDDAKDVDSWRDHYFSVRRLYFGGLCAWSVLMSINSSLILEVPLLDRSRIIPAGLMLVGVSGLATDKSRNHAYILVGALLVLLIAVVILMRPGALSAG